MNVNSWRRAGLAGILMAVLSVFALASPLAAQEEGPQAPVPSRQPEPVKPPTGQPPTQRAPQEPPSTEAAITVQSNLVDVDAVVTDQDGNLVTGLKRQNFRVFDDGQPQQITNFATSDAPITLVMLLEYSAAAYGYFAYNSEVWGDEFLRHLGPQDWVALKTFDLRSTLQTDFTQDKRAVDEAIRTLGPPTFHEADVFDALLETLNQLRDVKGKKSILLIATGFDTFSRHTLDDMLHRLKESDVTIFCVGTGEAIDLYSAGPDLGYIQAKNQLTTFAKMTGGYAYFPRFQGDLPSIFNTIAMYLRSQYTLVFSPSTPQDGKYHKITVEAVDDGGNPLELANKKGKKKKAVVAARQGYVAPRNAPAD
jgi:VWFA-related protein